METSTYYGKFIYWILYHLHYRCITKKQRRSGLEKGYTGMDLCLLGIFGNTSNTEQFMEYMECSIRCCLLFLRRAVVDHTCEWGTIESFLKRDKCLSQLNKTLHFAWVPPWELESWASPPTESDALKNIAVMGCCSNSHSVKWEVVCLS